MKIHTGGGVWPLSHSFFFNIPSEWCKNAKKFFKVFSLFQLNFFFPNDPFPQRDPLVTRARDLISKAGFNIGNAHCALEVKSRYEVVLQDYSWWFWLLEQATCSLGQGSSKYLHLEISFRWWLEWQTENYLCWRWWHGWRRHAGSKRNVLLLQSC